MLITPVKIMDDLLNDLCDGSVKDKNNSASDQKKQCTSFIFKIKSSTDQITRTVKKFDELLENNNCCSSRTKSELSTALSEALANAIIHGNKTNPKEFVDLDIQIHRDKMILKIKDKGPGFDYKELPDPLIPENIKKTNGRGIYLMSVLVDEVKFIRHHNGMEVKLIKYLPERNQYKN